MANEVVLNKIVQVLNKYKIRATYSAVAHAIGCTSLAVGVQLGERDPSKSWIVDSRTGLPTGYSPSQCHPELRSKITIIRTGDKLRELCRRSRQAGIDTKHGFLTTVVDQVPRLKIKKKRRQW